MVSVNTMEASGVDHFRDGLPSANCQETADNRQAWGCTNCQGSSVSVDKHLRKQVSFLKRINRQTSYALEQSDRACRRLAQRLEVCTHLLQEYGLEGQLDDALRMLSDPGDRECDTERHGARCEDLQHGSSCSEPSGERRFNEVPSSALRRSESCFVTSAEASTSSCERQREDVVNDLWKSYVTSQHALIKTARAVTESVDRSESFNEGTNLSARLREAASETSPAERQSMDISSPGDSSAKNIIKSFGGKRKYTTTGQPMALSRTQKKRASGAKKRISRTGKKLLLATIEAIPRSPAELWAGLRSIAFQTIQRIKEPIDPSNTYRIVWDLVMMLLLLYVTVVLPFRLAFEAQEKFGTPLYWFEITLDIFFALDIIANFRTAFVYEGQLVISNKEIAEHYLSTWFLIDVVSVIPFDFFISSDGVGLAKMLKSLRMVKMARLLKLLKLMKLMRLMKMPLMLQTLELFINRGMLRLLKFLSIVLMMAHFTACLFYFIAVVDGMTEDSWPIHFGLGEASRYSRYIASLYWAVSTMTTVGYGDIVPITDNERLVGIIAVLMGATVYAYFMGNMHLIVAALNMSGNRREQQMEMVDTFLRVHHVPPTISDRVRNYYDYLWQREVHNDEMSIMEGLSTSLKSELVLFIYRDMVESVPFFHNKHPQFITSVVLNLKLEIFAPGDGIASAGENGNHMYFIMNGTVTVRRQKEENVVRPGMIPHVQSYRERTASMGFDPYEEGLQDSDSRDRCGETIDTLTAGQYFGEVAVLTGQRRTASIVAETYCELYSLSKADIERVLQDWPEIAESFSLLGEAEELRDAKLAVKDDLEDLELPWMHAPVDMHAINKCPDSELPSICQHGALRPKPRLTFPGVRNKPGFTLVRDLLQVKAMGQTPPLSHRKSLREELCTTLGKDAAQDGGEEGTSTSKGPGGESKPRHWESPSAQQEMMQNTPGQPLQTFPSFQQNQQTPGATQSPKNPFGPICQEEVEKTIPEELCSY